MENEDVQDCKLTLERKREDDVNCNEDYRENEGRTETMSDDRASTSCDQSLVRNAVETEMRAQQTSCSLQPSNTAQGNSAVYAPVINNSNIGGSVNNFYNSTLQVLNKDDMPQDPGCSSAHKESDDALKRLKEKYKLKVKEKYSFIIEGNEDEPIAMDQIYTSLDILQGETAGVNSENEGGAIEYPYTRNQSSVSKIDCNDIFKPRKGKRIRCVLTKGIAGIGKTITVSKFILDWAEGKANQDIDFVFALPFREMHFLEDDQYTVLKLLNCFHSEILDPQINLQAILESCSILIIFDGLDESRLPLNFDKNKMLIGITETSSVDILLTNLIKGYVLPSAHLWITSRPAAAKRIPRKYFDLLTGIQGFSDSRKEDYFRKRFSNNVKMAGKVISFIKRNVTLHIMCHNPVMCWITAKILEHMFKKDEQEVPSTLTELFIHYLIVQTEMSIKKYEDHSEQICMDRKTMLEFKKDNILKLAQLAFEQLTKGNIIFYESDLSKLDLDASRCSEFLSEYLKADTVLHQRKVFCFIHLSFQEFLAALYVFDCYVEQNMNVLNDFLGDCTGYHEYISIFIYDLGFEDPQLRAMIFKFLHSEDGQFHLLLRFFCGLLLESNQNLLDGLLTQKDCSSEIEVITKSLDSSRRQLNNFFCLLEMKVWACQKDFEKYLQSAYQISPYYYSAVAQIILSFEEALDQLDLSHCNCANLDTIISALRNCKKAIIPFYRPWESSDSLGSILHSADSSLRELHINFNVSTLDKEGDICFLFDALRQPDCKLESLRMHGYVLNAKEVESLTSLLSSERYSLRELDLRHFTLLEEASWRTFLDALINSKLEILRMTGCSLSEMDCDALTSSSSNIQLKELDLSNNHLGSSGVMLFIGGLTNKLKKLRLSFCGVTEEGCASLASALRTTLSHLRELDLSYNYLGAPGMKLLSDLRDDPNCSLQTLSVDHYEDIRAKPQLLKNYARDLTLDPKKVGRYFSLADQSCRTMKRPKCDSYIQDGYLAASGEDLAGCCKDTLTGRSYWEVEGSWSIFCLSLLYKSAEPDSFPELSGALCSLSCSETTCSFHQENTYIRFPLLKPLCRVGVYLDWTAGILSFYNVDKDRMVHLHSLYTTFTEPLRPVFQLPYSHVCNKEEAFVSLCQLEKPPEGKS